MHAKGGDRNSCTGPLQVPLSLRLGKRRFKDIIVASYFVTAIGVVLELTAISLHDNEMESVCSLFCTARISHRPFL